MSDRENKGGRPISYQHAKRKVLINDLLDRRRSPIDVMLKYMHEALDSDDRDMALHCAQMAAPYLHPKLAAMAVKTDVEMSLSKLIEQSFAAPNQALSTELPQSLELNDEPVNSDDALEGVYSQEQD